MVRPTTALKSPVSWPAGQRAALVLIVDLDPLDLPWVVPSEASQSHAAERLFSMLGDLDIVPTVVIDPETEDEYPLSSLPKCDPSVHIQDAPADLSRANAKCTSRLGSPYKGIVLLTGMPSIPFAKQDVWITDGSGAPWPERAAKGKVVIPYSSWWHDITWIGPARPSPPSAFLEYLTVSMASVRSRGEVMTLMLTAQYSGQPGYVETIQRFLDEVIGAGDVWITNGTGMRNHIERAAEKT